MTVWVALEVGCLECEIHTTVVGIYRTKDAAIAALDDPIIYSKGEDPPHLLVAQVSHQVHEVTMEDL